MKLSIKEYFSLLSGLENITYFLGTPIKRPAPKSSGLERPCDERSDIQRSGDERSGIRKVLGTKGPDAKGPEEKGRGRE